MARGWESKSVEAQQAEASDSSNKQRIKLSSAEAAKLREKGNLHLARKRILQQMEGATNPRHRQMLQVALSDLDEKLKLLAG